MKLGHAFALYGKRIRTVLVCLEADDDLGDLLHRRERHAPFSNATCHGIAVQLLAASEHAHSRGIVNRDVKPDNILVLDLHAFKRPSHPLSFASASGRLRSCSPCAAPP